VPPVVMPYFPAEQLVQVPDSVAPAPVLYVPAEHERQNALSVTPVPVPYFPAVQAVQVPDSVAPAPV
jgi:hypothetical protein